MGDKDETPAYDPKPSLSLATSAGLQGAGVGLLVSTVQNALEKHSRGAMGVFTRTGGTIGFFSAMGASFALTEAVVANTREKDDSLNAASGGCAAGFLAGIRARSIPRAVAGCVVLGTVMGTYEATGSQLTGDGRAKDSREVREEARQRFFKQKPLASPLAVPVGEE